MKKIEAIYKFGNLYDKQTRKRILIEDGTDVSIVVDENRLLTEDPNLKPADLLDSEKKKNEIEAFIEKTGTAIERVNYWKIYGAGQLLFFDITAGVKRKDTTESIKCRFQIELLEDLYIYNKKSKPEDARFFKCQCIVKNCSANFTFFEPLYAKSLNDAYTKTYELYFAMFGSPTCNAFDRFYEMISDNPIRGLAESIQS